MKSSMPRIGLLGLIGIGLILSAGSGCAHDRAPRRWTDEPGYVPGQSNVVQRPVYSPSNAKPVFLGGYAGSSY